MAIVAVGVDLAKNGFAMHGVGDTGTAQLRNPKVARGKLNGLIAGLPPCLIGMEACTGAYHWAREFEAHGHTVSLHRLREVLAEVIEDAGNAMSGLAGPSLQRALEQWRELDAHMTGATPASAPTSRATSRARQRPGCRGSVRSPPLPS